MPSLNQLAVQKYGSITPACSCVFIDSAACLRILNVRSSYVCCWVYDQPLRTRLRCVFFTDRVW